MGDTGWSHESKAQALLKAWEKRDRNWSLASKEWGRSKRKRKKKDSYKCRCCKNTSSKEGSILLCHEKFLFQICVLSRFTYTSYRFFSRAKSYTARYRSFFEKYGQNFSLPTHAMQIQLKPLGREGRLGLPAWVESFMVGCLYLKAEIKNLHFLFSFSIFFFFSWVHVLLLKLNSGKFLNIWYGIKGRIALLTEMKQ